MASPIGNKNEAFVLHQEVDVKIYPLPINTSDINKSLDTLNEKNLEQAFSYKKLRGERVFQGTTNYITKYYKPSGDCLLNYMLDRLPFLRWLASYNLKEDLVKDLIAGLTIGVFHIPQ
jgi:hypothetical protein